VRDPLLSNGSRTQSSVGALASRRRLRHPHIVRTIGNILWLILAGWWLALLYVFFGILACILIVTIPFGIGAFRLAGYALWPFGRRVVRQPSAGVGSMIGNVIWVLLFGWELVVAHVVAGVLLCLTIIGIPFGIASFKLALLALVPLGAEIVPVEGEWTTDHLTPGTPGAAGTAAPA
jgi:uncharacterized membrane protein YccF (DUF307 family)